MHDADCDPTPKIHPATREMLPEDPMELCGHELPGDQELMMRLLVEEFARMGWSADAIMQLACDGQYQAFEGLRRAYGVEGMRERIAATLARCGVMRTKFFEAATQTQRLVELELPA